MTTKRTKTYRTVWRMIFGKPLWLLLREQEVGFCFQVAAKGNQRLEEYRNTNPLVAAGVPNETYWFEVDEINILVIRTDGKACGLQPISVERRLESERNHDNL